MLTSQTLSTELSSRARVLCAEGPYASVSQKEVNKTVVPAIDMALLSDIDSANRHKVPPRKVRAFGMTVSGSGQNA
jgi:hypothetical protein